MSTLNLVSVKNNTVSWTASRGNKVYSRKLKENNTFTIDKVTYQVDEANKKINVLGGVTPAQPLAPIQSEFSINARFNFLDKFAQMVLNKETASLIVTGEGGAGKSWTILNAIKEKGFVEVRDYVVIKGFSTPKALFAALFENNGKTIIFDDCDNILKDPVSLNILKSALDSYDKRTISWLTRGFVEDDLPSSFDFNGNVIFISNLNSEKMDQAVKSRSMVVDLSMTIQDKIERMQTILPNVLPRVSLKLKERVLIFMAAHSDEAKEFNIRTLIKLITVAKSYDNKDWYDAAKYLLVN